MAIHRPWIFSRGSRCMPKKLLIIVRDSRRLGGVETYLSTLLPRLAQDYKIAVLASGAAVPEAETFTSLRPLWYAHDARTAENVAAWRPQAVFNHGNDPALQRQILTRLPSLSGHTGSPPLPALFFAHDYSGFCATGTKMFAAPAPAVCSRNLNAGCLLRHYPRRCGGLNPITMGRDYRRQRALRSQINAYAGFVVASDYMKNELVRQGLAPERIHVAPYPVPEELRPQSSRPGNPVSAPFRLLMLARLTPGKGGAELILALREASQLLQRPLELTIAGDGPELPRLRRLAAQCRLNVHFPGWVGPQSRRELLAGAHLLVVPSIWPEPFGMVGLEAGAIGIPSVAMASGGIPEWLVPGVSGELAPLLSPYWPGLAQAIARALALDRHYAALCQGAREQAHGFTMQAHWDRLHPVLQSLFA